MVSTAATAVQTINQCTQARDASCVADLTSFLIGGPLAPGFRTPIRGVITGIQSVIGDALSDVGGHPFLTSPADCKVEAPGSLLRGFSTTTRGQLP